MEKERRFARYPVQRDAQYAVKERSGERKRCTIINVSRAGMGMIFYSNEEINVGTTIHLEIPVPRSSEPIHVRGVLRWFDRNETDFVGGVELTEMLSDVKFSKLG